jgi:hypothetical protein
MESHISLSVLVVGLVLAARPEEDEGGQAPVVRETSGGALGWWACSLGWSQAKAGWGGCGRAG